MNWKVLGFWLCSYLTLVCCLPAPHEKGWHSNCTWVLVQVSLQGILPPLALVSPSIPVPYILSLTKILSPATSHTICAPSARPHAIDIFLKKTPMIWESKHFFVLLSNNFVGLSSKVSTDSYKEIPPSTLPATFPCHSLPCNPPFNSPCHLLCHSYWFPFHPLPSNPSRQNFTLNLAPGHNYGWSTYLCCCNYSISLSNQLIEQITTLPAGFLHVFPPFLFFLLPYTPQITILNFHLYYINPLDLSMCVFCTLLSCGTE